MKETYKFGERKILPVSEEELNEMLPLINEQINDDFVSFELEFKSVNYKNTEALKKALLYAHKMQITAYDETHDFFDVCLAVDGESLRISRFHFWLVDNKFEIAHPFEMNKNAFFVETKSFVFDF